MSVSQELFDAIIQQADWVEKELVLIGIPKQDLQKRSSITIEGMTRTYFFDGVPIMKSSIDFRPDGTISFTAKRLI